MSFETNKNKLSAVKIIHIKAKNNINNIKLEGRRLGSEKQILLLLMVELRKISKRRY